MFVNKKVRENLSKGSRVFARKYGWNEIAKKYEKLCFEVLSIEKQKESLT